MADALVERRSALRRRRHTSARLRRQLASACGIRRPSRSSVLMNAATLVRKIDIAQAQADHSREILRREWLLTNGLGGYASGTISGTISRRYHGLLVAALPAPFGRVVMLNHLAEILRLPNGQRLLIGGQ